MLSACFWSCAIYCNKIPIGNLCRPVSNNIRFVSNICQGQGQIICHSQPFWSNLFLANFVRGPCLATRVLNTRWTAVFADTWKPKQNQKKSQLLHCVLQRIAWKLTGIRRFRGSPRADFQPRTLGGNSKAPLDIHSSAFGPTWAKGVHGVLKID